MKKIIASLAMIVLVGTLVVGATRAIFSDTETSFDNTFVAGTLDLKVDGEDDGATVAHIELSDMKPGDTQTYSWTLSNSGSLTGKPWIEIVNLVDSENSCNEPELTVPDSTCGDLEGELSDYLFLQINAPGITGYWHPNKPECISPSLKNCPLGTWEALGPVIGNTGEIWEQIAPFSSVKPMVLEFSIPESVGNIIQSDSVEFDIVFHLDQI